jgi:hypothetical protein
MDAWIIFAVDLTILIFIVTLWLARWRMDS